MTTAPAPCATYMACTPTNGLASSPPWKGGIGEIAYLTPLFLMSGICHGPESRKAAFLPVKMLVTLSGLIERLSAPSPFSPSSLILSKALTAPGLPTPRSLGS